MAPEVRRLPPLLALWLVFTSAPPLQVAAQTPETQGSAVDPGSVEAKARLLQELDQRIEERRREIAREEQALTALRRALEVARRELEEERIRLEALKAEIEADIAKRRQVVDERLDQIAKVYGAMKPREAALALSGMDDELAVSILERLQGRTTGKIFDLMAKERVRELTLLLERGRPGPGE